MATIRLAWQATAASKRLRARRAFPNPLSRGWASNQPRTRLRAPVVHTYEVGRTDQAGVPHVDEPVAEDVGAEQHLPVPALEMAE